MSLIVLVMPAPADNSEIGKIEMFLQEIGPLPDGVAQVAQNVLLIETTDAPAFLLKAGRIAGALRQNVQAYTSVPTPPAA